jgi:uncharacterized protein YajQ (UPF0234 family)
MLDPKAVTKLVEDQIARSVNDQVLEVFATDEWLRPIEAKIIDYTQQRILGKFANSSALPEIVEAVKTSVAELFASGQIPGVDQYIDEVTIKQTIDQAVQDNIVTAIKDLGRDPAWLEKIERLINQSMVQRVVAGLSTIDVNGLIRQRVDENMTELDSRVAERLQTPGIQDHAQQPELTVLDENVVVENCLTANRIEVVNSAKIRELTVTGSINTDNRAWQTLSEDISEKTLNRLTNQWKESLIEDVEDKIRKRGINFTQVQIDGVNVFSGDTLSRKITNSSLQRVGALQDLTVSGEAHIYNTVSVLNKRLGVNTQEPEMALSVWDEEVSILAGKFKDRSAYIGTGRLQNLVLGVNRTPAVEIDVDGVTAVKKLRVGVHRISHGTEVPNYAGTKGDVVFNANPSINDNVFAWQCLGGFKWKIIRTVE